MGREVTQTRKLPATVHYYRRADVVRTSNNAVPLVWGPYQALLGSSDAPTQTTQSWRTDISDMVSGDPLSAEARRDFQKVTYNPWTEQRLRYPTWDTGHNFFTTKTAVGRVSHAHIIRFAPIPGTNLNRWYDGPLIPSNGSDSSSFPPLIRLSSNDQKMLGAHAVSKTAPTAPQVSLSTFLGELFKEGIPAIVGLSTLKERTGLFRSIGGEYLNVRFGWEPFIKELQDSVRTLQHTSELIAQFERDSGRPVKRHFRFPNEVVESSETDVEQFGSNFAFFTSQANDIWFNSNAKGQAPSQLVRKQHVYRHVYFKGQFVYSAHKGNTFLDRIDEYEQKANVLLGTRVTPEVLWNLAPWSWLLDWWLNIGDILSNASYLSTDGLVMKYGYLMAKHTSSRTYYIPGDDYAFTGGGSLGTVSATFTRVTKERFRATPYGFGLSAGSFTPYQWAILGALGLTKSPRALP